MKRALICALVVLMCWASYSLISWAAYTEVDFSTFVTEKTMTGDWITQKMEVWTPLVWYEDSTAEFDSCIDTIFTPWIFIGGNPPGKSLDKLIYYFRITSIDTFGYMDSATWFNIGYQTSADTHSSALTDLRILRTHATDTFSVKTLQSDSIYTGTIYSGYIRGRIIYNIVADSARFDWSLGYYSATVDLRTSHKPFNVEEYVLPIWR